MLFFSFSVPDKRGKKYVIGNGHCWNFVINWLLQNISTVKTHCFKLSWMLLAKPVTELETKDLHYL